MQQRECVCWIPREGEKIRHKVVEQRILCLKTVNKKQLTARSYLRGAAARRNDQESVSTQRVKERRKAVRGDLRCEGWIWMKPKLIRRSNSRRAEAKENLSGDRVWVCVREVEGICTLWNRSSPKQKRNYLVHTALKKQSIESEQHTVTRSVMK